MNQIKDLRPGIASFAAKCILGFPKHLSVSKDLEKYSFSFF